MLRSIRFALAAATLCAGADAFAQTAPDPCANLPTLPGEGTPNAGSTPAQPQPNGTPALSAAQVSQAFLRCALNQFTRHEYRQAIRYFDLANRAAPSADLHYNIARAHELLNEYEEAAGAYERYLRDKVNAPDRTEIEARIRQLRDLARRRREAARQQDGRALLTVNVDQPGARVRIDEREAGTSPIASGVQVQPGNHRLVVELDGYQLWQGVVRARAGETGRADVVLGEATRYRTQPAPHIASFALGGTGAAAIVAGVVLGIVASQRDVGNVPDGSYMPCVNPQATGCGPTSMMPITHVTGYSCDPSQPLTCNRDGLLIGSSVAISAGVALVTGAVIAWFVEAGSGRTERVRATDRARASR